MKIDWSALGTVFGVSLAVVLGIVVLFSAGLRVWSARDSRGGATALASVCFAGCFAVVGFGVYLIVAR
ncbi:hypothetical protein GCM10022243_62550 [Saccharothrix violaceirubra]|uniref:Putative membrane protein YccC n=1 Tax=Saccharothrix violaceirubra TaxID=413306 RepID=A0A7W7T7X5_9PSEU|nr:hypothetical protein [Saccharothrix violaceirubra]MBB4968233.1 putative membrane protein YccC [Saccharothrix violaceirubra]